MVLVGHTNFQLKNEYIISNGLVVRREIGANCSHDTICDVQKKNKYFLKFFDHVKRKISFFIRNERNEYKSIDKSLFQKSTMKNDHRLISKNKKNAFFNFFFFSVNDNKLKFVGTTFMTFK